MKRVQGILNSDDGIIVLSSFNKKRKLVKEHNLDICDPTDIDNVYNHEYKTVTPCPYSLRGIQCQRKPSIENVHGEKGADVLQHNDMKWKDNIKVTKQNDMGKGTNTTKGIIHVSDNIETSQRNCHKTSKNENNAKEKLGRFDSGYDSEGSLSDPLEDLLEEEEEDDTLVAHDTSQTYLNQPPPSSKPILPSPAIDRNVWCHTHQKSQGIFQHIFEALSLDKTTPDKKSVIYIDHLKKTDTPQGDWFGAQLFTFEKSKRYPSNRHFLCNVDKDGPASTMRIKDWDELVLVNGHFVPDLSHTTVLNIFHDVKVDGKTRLSMVIRRQIKKTRQSDIEWQWIETSAVLAPYHKTITPEHVQYLENARDTLDLISQHTYQVNGISEYLSISPVNGIQAVPLDRDTESTSILKWVKLRFNKGYHYTCALGVKKDTDYWYINMKNEQVTCTREKQWLTEHQDGTEVRFCTNDHMYLACHKGLKTFHAISKSDLDMEKNIYSGVFLDYPVEMKSSDAPLDEPN